MSTIKALGVLKIKGLGLDNIRNIENSYRFFLEKKGKYHSVASNYPNLYLEKISYQEYSRTINLKYQ